MTYDIVVGRNAHDLKKYGTEGTIFLGKHYVKMGRTTSLSNKVFLDMITSHVVFICGKRGGGKCLTGDSRITLANGEVVQIKDLEERKETLLSLNKELKVNEQSIDAFYKRKAETILKIRLRTGKELTLTPEHPLLTVAGWEEVRALGIGSRIATPRIQPSFGDCPLPEHEVKLLAYLLAEGHLNNNQVLFSNIDHKILADFSTAVSDYDSQLSIKEHSKPGCYRIIGRKPKSKLTKAAQDKKGRFTKATRIDNRSGIRKWLDKHCMYGKLAKERAMPKAIYTLPKHQLSLFLNRLFSCDGSIYKEGKHTWKVSYSSASKPFIQAIQHLLLRFGVISTLRNKTIKGFESYELEIKGEFVHTFLNEIGFFSEKAKKATLAIKETIKITRNPNLDTIPKEIWNSYKPENWAALGRKLDYKHPKALRESTRYAPSRQKLLQIAQADQNQLLETLATSDIYWDEIIAVEHLEGGLHRLRSHRARDPQLHRQRCYRPQQLHDGGHRRRHG
jgi:replicative DNA helicase